MVYVFDDFHQLLRPIEHFRGGKLILAVLRLHGLDLLLDDFPLACMVDSVIEYLDRMPAANQVEEKTISICVKVLVEGI